MKIYKKGLTFLVAKTLKVIRNYSLKLAKVFPQYPFPFKANVSLYSDTFQYSAGIKTCKKFTSPKRKHQQKFFGMHSGFSEIRVNLLKKKKMCCKTKKIKEMAVVSHNFKEVASKLDIKCKIGVHFSLNFG